MAMLVSGRVYQNSERVPGIHHTRSSVPASQARPNRRREVTSTTTGTKVKELDMGLKLWSFFSFHGKQELGGGKSKIAEDEPIFTHIFQKGLKQFNQTKVTKILGGKTPFSFFVLLSELKIKFGVPSALRFIVT